jgi:hypothetical protein
MALLVGTGVPMGLSVPGVVILGELEITTMGEELTLFRAIP